MAHPAERAWIEDIDLQNRERPVPGFSTLVEGSVQLDHELTDGDVIDSDGTEEYELQVFQTPGHSTGSISLLVQGEGALFCGDAVPVEGDLPVYDDALASMRSLKRSVGSVISSLHGTSHGRVKPHTGRWTGRSYTYRRFTILQLPHQLMDHQTRWKLQKKLQLHSGCPQMVTPLLARTFGANMRVRVHRDLATLT